MGYILVIVALVVVIPLVLLLGRKTSTGGGGLRHTSRGVTVEEPSSDQPSPAGGSVNQPRVGAEKKLPPG